MNTPYPHSLQSFAGADSVSGCWKLSEGRALTLRPTEPGELRVAHGVVWVTFENAQLDDSVRGGDHFFGAGESIKLLPGQAVVVEPWAFGKGSAAYFSWDPLPAAAGLAVASRPRRVFAASGVVQPLRDLRLAFGLAASASGRLGLGLANAAAEAVVAVLPRPALDLIAGRTRGALLARAFRAQSSAKCAQCPIA